MSTTAVLAVLLAVWGADEQKPVQPAPPAESEAVLEVLPFIIPWNGTLTFPWVVYSTHAKLTLEHDESRDPSFLLLRSGEQMRMQVKEPGFLKVDVCVIRYPVAAQLSISDGHEFADTISPRGVADRPYGLFRGAHGKIAPAGKPVVWTKAFKTGLHDLTFEIRGDKKASMGVKLEFEPLTSEKPVLPSPSSPDEK